jgi:hypothetical protein
MRAFGCGGFGAGTNFGVNFVINPGINPGINSGINNGSYCSLDSGALRVQRYQLAAFPAQANVLEHAGVAVAQRGVTTTVGVVGAHGAQQTIGNV